jgi:hypothetical protein
MTFDGADGYVVLFGGYVTGAGNSSGGQFGTGKVFNDTWVYSAPAELLNISISASPSQICSRESLSCGLGTDETRVSLSVSTEPSAPNDLWEADNGSGTMVYGPYQWAATPILDFVGWQNLTPAPNLDPSVTCEIAGGGTPGCPTSALVTSLPSGGEMLSWSWFGSGVASSIRLGDEWNVSFNEIALGPPFGMSVPADSCTTPACGALHDGPAYGSYSSLEFYSSGGASQVTDSIPLGTVEVWPQLVQSNAPPPVQAPPPPIAGPSPLPAPTTPIVAPPNPIGATVPSLAASSAISGLAAGAAVLGLIAAGVTRVTLARPAQALGVPIRAETARRHRAPFRWD